MAVAGPQASPALSELSRVPSYFEHPQPPSYFTDGLAHGPPVNRPTETVVRRNDIITIALKDVPVEATSGRPIFDRGGNLHGEISLSSIQDISSLVVRLEGRVKIRIAELTSTHYTFLDVPVTLRPAENILPFSITVPETFADRDSGEAHPLPPCVDLRDKTEDQDELRVRLSYRLVATVNRTALHLSKTVEIELAYWAPSPQNWQMPARAGLNLTDSKEVPLGWNRADVDIPAAPPSTIDPVQCNLFYPSAQTFGLQNVVPFSITMRAPSQSMRELFVPTVPKQLRKKEKSEHFPPPTLRVFIKRQIVCSIQAITIAHSFTIGESSMRMGAPSYTNFGDALVAYEGEVRFNDNVKYGSFSAGKISISVSVGEVRLRFQS